MTIYAILDTLVSGLHPDILPENATLPATVYIVNDTEKDTLDGDMKYSIDFEIYGDTRLQTTTEFDRIFAIVNNFVGSVGTALITAIIIDDKGDDFDGTHYTRSFELQIYVD